MTEEKKKAIEVALRTAGLKEGKIVIGTYETGHKGRVGVYFHYKYTEELAQALIQLALQDRTVYEGLKELRQNFALTIGAVKGAGLPKSKEPIH
jgi:hypothetical protein